LKRVYIESLLSTHPRLQPPILFHPTFSTK
jgi:hypothetical protein